MRVLVVCGRIDEREWTAGSLIKRLVRSLGERGHSLHVVCQAVEDPLALSDALALHAYETYRSGASDYAAGFPRWARSLMRAADFAASLSLSRRVAGNVWMPLDAAGEPFLSNARSAGGLFGLAAAAARHAGVLLDTAAQRLHPLPRGDEILSTVCVGEHAAEAARHFAGGILSEGVIQAPLASALEPCPAQHSAAERAAVRSLLALEADRFTVLAPFMTGGGPWLRALTRAVGNLNQGSRPGPALLILTPEPFKAHAAALAAGCEQSVRVLGTTASVRAALAACDAAAVAAPCAGNAFLFGACSRFGADAVRCGRPVLAVTGSGGQAAAELSSPEAGRAGMVVAESTPEAWTAALAAASEDPWLARATLAAERLSTHLAFARLIDAVEIALHEAAG